MHVVSSPKSEFSNIFIVFDYSGGDGGVLSLRPESPLFADVQYG